MELRSELEELGYHFRTGSDTEVVLYSYIEWGSAFQNKCNGMWGLAIWDNIKKELFLSRDRFGVKPLYYYEENHNFYFASEMKAFFPVMSERKINYHVFESKNYFAYEATPDCCIRGIHKVGAGQCGYVKNGRLDLYRWWNTLDHLMDVPQKYDDQVECLRQLFLDACRIRMRSDVPIGTALSGGVDSSAVVGALKLVSNQSEEYAADWQHAYVASMPNTRLDETQYAEIAAAYVGLEIKKVLIETVPAEELFRYMYICEDPYITSPVPFMQTYGAIGADGVKVTIDGHGADELFGGYSFDFIYAVGAAENDPDKIKDIYRTYNGIMTTEDRISYQHFSDMIKDLTIRQEKDQFRTMDVLNRRLYESTHVATLPTILRCYERYGMGNGLEIRMPFMDYRIVSFAFSIPWHSKINGGYSKKIIRDMAAPFMDKRIMYRKTKIGFNSPMTEWMLGAWKEFILDTIHSREFHECGLLNPLDVQIEVEAFYQSERHTFAMGETVWKSLVPFLWKKSMRL